jgi:hypothetical protein
MLNRVTAIILLTALVSANFSRYFVYAGFELNRNYIAAKLCENRNKPWLHCNGRCYFMKKIKQVQESEKNEERQSQKNLFQEVFLIAATNIKFHTRLLRKIATPYRFAISSVLQSAIFQPPRA